MKCFHCKQRIQKQDNRSYVVYQARKDGPIHYRYWCAGCATDEIVDREAPKDYRDEEAKEDL